MLTLQQAETMAHLRDEIDALVERSNASPITVVTNWTPRVKD
jgi:hypothetical protein